MWYKKCEQDSDKLHQQLLQKLPLSPWSDTTAQALAKDISDLATLSRKDIHAEITERNEPAEYSELLLLCVEYTKSLRSKNIVSFFRNYKLDDDAVHLVCATTLLVVYRDVNTNPQGFFAILLKCWLAKPMSAVLREGWETKHILPQDTLATSRSGSSLTIQEPVVATNETMSKPGAKRATATCVDSAGQLPPCTAKDEEVQNVNTMASASIATIQEAAVDTREITSEPEAERAIATCVDTVAPLPPYNMQDGEAEKVNVVDSFARERPLSVEEVAQEMRLQEIRPNEEFEPVPDLSRLEFDYGVSRKERHRAAIFKSVKYAPDVDENPFTDSERLVFLEALLQMAKSATKEVARLESELHQTGKQDEAGEKLFASPIISFEEIADLLPRRSRIECIQHHASTRKRIVDVSKKRTQELARLNKLLGKLPVDDDNRVSQQAADSADDDLPVKKKSKSGKGRAASETYFDIENRIVHEVSSIRDAILDRCESRLDAMRHQCAEELASKEREIEQERQDIYVEASQEAMQLEQQKIALDSEKIELRTEFDFLARQSDRAVEAAATMKERHEELLKDYNARLHQVFAAKKTVEVALGAANSRADVAEDKLADTNVLLQYERMQAKGKAKAEQDLELAKKAIQDGESKHEEAMNEQSDGYCGRLQKRDNRIEQLEKELVRNGLAVPPPPKPFGPKK